MGLSLEGWKKQWKENQYKNKQVLFAGSATNTAIYFYYLMATSEEYAEEQKWDGDESQQTNLIPLSHLYPDDISSLFTLFVWTWLSLEKEI